MSGTGERAFARHISRQSANEIRQEASSAFKEDIDSSLKTLESAIQQSESSLFQGSSNTLLEPEVPLDYERYLEDNQMSIHSDPLQHLLLYPDDDVQVATVRRTYRTVDTPVPGGAKRCEDPLVKECVSLFTSDWSIVERRYGAFHGQDQATLMRRFSSLKRTSSGVKLLPQQEYEVDMQEEVTDSVSIGSTLSIGSAYDLEATENDPLKHDLLEQPLDERELDDTNSRNRQGPRFSSLFSLYSLPDREELIETRQPAPVPAEPEGLKILIKVSELRLEPLFEPIFIVLALYDAREKKKISESFHMDMNPSEVHHMLDDHTRERNIATLGRSAIFSITNPHKDIYLVIKLEKVLQRGDIPDAAEPYHRELDKKSEEKVRTQAQQYCRQLGQYRMPLAWAPVNVIDIITGNAGAGTTAVSSSQGPEPQERLPSTSGGGGGGGGGGDRRSVSEPSGRPKKDPKGSISSKSGLAMSGEFSRDDNLNISSSFASVTLAVNAFFRQDADKLHDDNIFRYLSEMQKQPAALHRRLKSIPATLKLDVSPPYDSMPCCLTSSLWQVRPYPEANRRPTREMEEFPSKEVFASATTYKNFLYVYPQSADLRSQSKGQNIGVKVQFMAGEDPKVDSLQILYGRSSGPRFVREYWCPVIYHNKSPEFYDEIKVELPSQLTDRHHLLFSFYHISCKKPKPNEDKQEPVFIGCSWIPLYKDGITSMGLFDLPILGEFPPSHYSAVPAEGNLPSLKWMDGHRPLFRVQLSVESSLHPQDRHVTAFLRRCYELEAAGDKGGDIAGLLAAMKALSNANTRQLVLFLHQVLNNLFTLVVRPCSSVEDAQVPTKAFQAIAMVAHTIYEMRLSSDKHGRNVILASFIQHVLNAPVGSFGSPKDRRTTMLGDAKMVFGEEVDGRLRTSSVKGHSSSSTLPSSKPAGGQQQQQSDGFGASRAGNSGQKMLHEDISWAWVATHKDPKLRKAVLSNAWFFFDVMIKSMAQYLQASGRFGSPRKSRFPEGFHRDLELLVEHLTQEITETHVRTEEYASNLNLYLAFFIHDAFSLMDRGFVFGLIRTYLKKISLSQVDYNLTEYKIHFLRVICNNEHYVPLNLPLKPSLLPVVQEGSPSPPGSLASGLDEVGLSSMDAIAELSPEFRQHHYLSGLVLTELSVILDSKGNKLREQAIEMLRDLIAAQDNDVRYSSTEARRRIATIYFPLLPIVMQHYSILFKERDPGNDGSPGGGGGPFERSGDYRRSVIIHPDDKGGDESPELAGGLGPAATKNLLVCFLWLLKNLEGELLQQWWAQLKISDVNDLINVLDLAVQTFEYRGRKTLLSVVVPGFAAGGTTSGGPSSTATGSDVKAQLAAAILGGQGTAMHMLRSRRRVATAKGTDTASLQKRWGRTFYAQASEQPEKPKVDANIDAFVESSLSAECSLTILDTVEELIQTIATKDHLSSCLGGCLGVLLQLMNTTQSNEVMTHIFATQRAIVFKFPELLFEEEIEQCAELCASLLRHCGSKITEIRTLATASLYQLMRQNFDMGQNFARVKVQVTIALSSIVTSKLKFNETFLRRSLKTLIVYAMEETELADTNFPEQVRMLAHNLNHILSNTIKLQQYQDDMEMYMDLMDSIARGYQNSPDLRLQWLQHMAEKHVQHKNQVEAAMCIVHAAALVAEYLYILERKPYLPIGCVAFQKISPNILEESAISDDIISPEEEGLCNPKFFSEYGFIGLMEYAAQLFYEAKMYESMNEVYKLVTPIHEYKRNFDKLEKIHSKLHMSYQKIVSKSGKRFLATFFRVGFYGSLFNDLDKQEFICKEEGHTHLAEFSVRLEKQYSNKIGANNVVMMKDSNKVSPELLDPTKGYIQITYVEPFFDDYEIFPKMSAYDKTVNICRFSFRTPFTAEGKAHGQLSGQFMRRTILTTEDHLPSVKTRVRVVAFEEVVLEPVQFSTTLMQDKISSLRQALSTHPLDVKFLQMQLQGGVATSVNQGPFSIAHTFLAEVPAALQTHHHQRLRVCFKEFKELCRQALLKNKGCISADQEEYQRELERQYQDFVHKLDPMLKQRRKHHSNPRRHRENTRLLEKISKSSRGGDKSTEQ